MSPPRAPSFRERVRTRERDRRPQKSLLVPMCLDALRIVEDGFGAWADLTGDAAFAPRPPRPYGVYLHWSMPEALRRWREERIGDRVVQWYGLLPNRAVVVRLSHPRDGGPAAWTLFPVDAPRLTSHGPIAATTPPASFTEPARPGWVHSLGVTFPARPADPLFTAIYDRCDGKMTFFDDLAGVDPRVHPTVSYLVAAWYQHPDDDVVHRTGGGCALRRLIEEMGWALSRDPGDIADGTLDGHTPPPLPELFRAMGIPAEDVATPSPTYEWRLLAHGAVFGINTSRGRPAPPRHATSIVLAADAEAAAMASLDPGASLATSRLRRAWAGDALGDPRKADAALHSREFIASSSGSDVVTVKTAPATGWQRSSVATEPEPQKVERPRAPWWEPRDPTLVIMGCDRSYRHGQDGRFRADGRVLVRLTDSVVSAFRGANGVVIAADLLAQALTDGDFPDAPEGIAALAAELALMSESSAEALSRMAGMEVRHVLAEQRLVWLAGRTVDLGSGPVRLAPGGFEVRKRIVGEAPSRVAMMRWTQPWIPLILDWRGQVAPDDAARWALGDVDFVPPVDWDPNTALVRPLSRRAVLTQGNLEQVRDRLDRAAARVDDSRIGSFDELTSADSLFATLVGVRAALAPQDGEPELLAGAFRLEEVQVVDAFGRVLSTDEEQCVIAPDDQVEGAARWFALPPRLVGRGRALLELLQPDGTREPNGDPVPAGFLLPDHVDDALEAYDTRGGAIGQLRVRPTGGAPEVVWEVAPGGDAPLGSLPATPDPTMTGILRGIATAARGGESALTAWLRAIDTTLWSVDPLGRGAKEHMTLLVGRPLAVYRARVKVELDGFAAGTPLKVRLGGPSLTDDGLIGYYRDGDHGRFHLVHPSMASALPSLSGGGFLSRDPAVRAAARDGFTQGTDARTPLTHPMIVAADGLDVLVGQEVALTLVVDPRGTLALTSGVFPRETVEITRRSIATALAGFELSFRIGPVLADPEAIRMPLMTDIQGRWAWMRRPDPAMWEEVPVEPVGKSPRLSPRSIQIHYGWLKVADALDLDENGELPPT